MQEVALGTELMLIPFRMARRYRKLSNLDRARALGQLQMGRSSWVDARVFNTSHQSIDRIRQHYAATGDVKDLSLSGRPKAKSRVENRLITNAVLRNKLTNAPEMIRHIRQERGPGGRSVSFQTFRNRLHVAGLQSSVPTKKTWLSQRHRAARLQFTLNMWDGPDNSGGQSSSQMRADFVLDPSTGDNGSGVGGESIVLKWTCYHVMLIMVEA